MLVLVLRQAMMEAARSAVMRGSKANILLLATLRFSFDASSISPKCGVVTNSCVLVRPMSQ